MLWMFVPRLTVGLNGVFWVFPEQLQPILKVWFTGMGVCNCNSSSWSLGQESSRSEICLGHSEISSANKTKAVSRESQEPGDKNGQVCTTKRRLDGEERGQNFIFKILNSLVTCL